MQIDRIEIRITEINRNGEVTVKLSSKNQNGDSSEILKLISNKTIEVSVHSEEVPNYKVPH
jgi:hypothetical protein